MLINAKSKRSSAKATPVAHDVAAGSNPNRWHCQELAELHRAKADNMIDELSLDIPKCELTYVTADEVFYEILDLPNDDEPETQGLCFAQAGIRLRAAQPLGVVISTFRRDANDRSCGSMLVCAVDERGEIEGWRNSYKKPRRQPVLETGWERIPDEELDGLIVWTLISSVNNQVMAREFLQRHGASIGITVNSR
jgi:hypothetical protein